MLVAPWTEFLKDCQVLVQLHADKALSRGQGGRQGRQWGSKALTVMSYKGSGRGKPVQSFLWRCPLSITPGRRAMATFLVHHKCSLINPRASQHCTSTILGQFVFLMLFELRYSHVRWEELNYYPHFTNEENDAQRSDLHEVTQLVHGGAKIRVEASSACSTAHCLARCCTSSQRRTPTPGLCHPVCFPWPKILTSQGSELSSPDLPRVLSRSHSSSHVRRNSASMNRSSKCEEERPSGPQATDRAPPQGSCFPVNVILDLFLDLKPSSSSWPPQNPWLRWVREVIQLLLT